MQMKLLFVLAVFISFFVTGCAERKESPVKGNIEVYADESLYPVVAASADTFQKLYNDVHITLREVSAREAIVKVLNGESRMCVTARMLNAGEDSFKVKNAIELKSMKYCLDGVTLITDEKDELKMISYDSLRMLFAGRLKYRAVLPSLNSSVREFIESKFDKNEIQKNCIIVESEKDVIKAVRGLPGRIGFIGWNNVSGAGGMNFVKAGAEVQKGAVNSYYEPHPGFFVQSLYPLTRKCVIILREINSGPATGFSSFLTSTEGQKIVLKQNLGPQTVPVRLVQ